MIKSTILFSWCLILTTGLLTTRYLLADLWLWAILALLLGIFWWVEYREKHVAISHVIVIGIIAVIIEGLQLGFEPLWSLLTVLLLLAAWDLHHFTIRLAFARNPKSVCDLEQQHLRRLALVNAIGFVCAGIAITVRFRLNFGLLLLLTALAVVCLSRFIRHLSQESE